MLTDHANECAESERMAAEIGAQFPPSPESQAAEALATDILRSLRDIKTRIIQATVAPYYGPRWDELSDLIAFLTKHKEKSQ
jgi:hypothetical protein